LRRCSVDLAERQSSELRLGGADNAEEIELLDDTVGLVELDAFACAEIDGERLRRESEVIVRR
jgi:hypothetical protein